LQSCDTELLAEDEAVGADAGGVVVAVCAYACPASATHPIKASEAFIFDCSVLGGRDLGNDRLYYTPHEDLDAPRGCSNGCAARYYTTAPGSETIEAQPPAVFNGVAYRRARKSLVSILEAAPRLSHEAHQSRAKLV